MSLLFISYIFNFLALLVLGVFFLKKYFNASGIFFLIFCIWTGIWFILYFLTYFWSNSHDVLILLAQWSYACSVVSLYSFVLFLYCFSKKNIRIYSWIVYSYILFSCCLILFYTQTHFIIEGLYFNEVKNDWYETEGSLFLFHIVLSLFFIPLALFLGIKSMRELKYIEKRRLQFILLWVLIFVCLSFVFLLILPIFGLWIMERYIAIFFTPFIIGVFYAIRQYDFLNIKIAFVQLIIFIYSILCSFLIVSIIANFTETLAAEFKYYWGFSESSLFVELVIGIISFTIISKLLRDKFYAISSQNKFYNSLDLMREKIPFILNINWLNIFLESFFRENLWIYRAHISKWTSKKYRKIKNFFITYENDVKVIILDTVFLEENKNKLWPLYDELKWDTTKIYMIFPLRSRKWDIIWFFEVWGKPLWDPFLTHELKSLHSFSDFLNSHLKYIEIYTQIQDLTVSLDKRVDEKTIEFNNLLSKQKEFIAYVGHEIKNPITNTLFLSDAIKESLEDSHNAELKEDADILYKELFKVWELVKYIFSAEKFDLWKVELYTKEINLSTFLQEEVESFRHKIPNINFIDSIKEDIFRDIDETQFRQVIQNLINNALKFTSATNPTISISLKKIKNKIQIYIEDNGKGFSKIDLQEVFWKYTTGWWSATGLGMGLYLCKKIIELHGGNIKAQSSKNLWGACFFIEI